MGSPATVLSAVFALSAPALADEAPPSEHTVMVRGESPRPATASSSVVSSAEFAAVPHRTAADALRLVPGLTLVQHGSEGKGLQFFLRGFDAAHGSDIEITVDGIPANEWSNIHGQGYVDLGAFIPELVQDVHVTKGPFLLDQGAFAMAGSAAFRLGVGAEDLGLRSTLTLGTTGRERGVVSFSPKDGDGTEFIATQALHDDGFGQNRQITSATTLGRKRLFESEKYGSLSFLAVGYVARFGLPGTVRNDDVAAGRVGFYDAYDRDTRGLSGRGLGSLEYQWSSAVHDVRAQLSFGYRRLELLENYTGFLIDPLRGDRRAQSADTFSLNADVGTESRLFETWSLLAGVGVRADSLDQHQDHVDQMERVVGADQSLSGVQALSHARLGLGWRPNRSWRWTGGMRVDVAALAARDRLALTSSPAALANVSPRTTLEWQVWEGWRLYFAYGRGFRPPEARAFSTFEPERTGIADDVYTGGAPAITVADAFELGMRSSPNRYLSSRLAGFATLIEREAIFDHVSGLNLELNGTRRLGGELELRVTPVPWLTLIADATLVDARFTGSGNVVPLAPWLAGGVRGVLAHPDGWRAGLHAAGFMPRALPHGAVGAAYLSLDATAGYHWRRVRIDLELENVLNQGLREGEYHYASHWQSGSAPSELPALHTAAGPPLNARLSVTAFY